MKGSEDDLAGKASGVGPFTQGRVGPSKHRLPGRDADDLELRHFFVSTVTRAGLRDRGRVERRDRRALTLAEALSICQLGRRAAVPA